MDPADAAVIHLLDSVDELLRIRQIVSTQLSEGWMAMARARYAMGHFRINESLFSLKPHAALVLVGDGGKSSQMQLDVRRKDEISDQIISDEDLSDGESVSPKEMVSYNRRVDPMSCFGGLVSPHLRASRRHFENALGALLDMANTQRSVLEAESKFAKTLQQSASESQEFRI